MIKIDRQIIHEIHGAADRADLARYLQRAIELEHATIPPYLTAMYSLIPGTNDEIAALIRSVVIEEMSHMTIAANILVAIGGQPRINHPAFIPAYPGPLPMGIGEGLIVPIKAFSLDLVRDVFMKIEEPENPIPIPTFGATAVEPDYATIGEFYTAIRDKIDALGDSIFTVGPERQVLSWFGADVLWPIVDARSADQALAVVETQGEGTHADPFESGDVPAHYYRFGEIAHGRKLIRTTDGYAYGGDLVPFDPAGVYPMIDNPCPADYPAGSHLAQLSETFSFGYSNLLNVLHRGFNGAPRAIDSAIGLMYQLRLTAQTLMATPVGQGTRTAGPVFRYVTSE